MANKKPLVLIGLACQRFVFARTVFSLMGAIADRDYDIIFTTEMCCDIAAGRNRLAAQAKERGATHLLFVDYDMYFPPDTISRLLKHDKDIVGAAYNKRKDPPESTAVPVEEPAPSDKLFKCQALGTGLLLIKMSVFDTFKSPWFMFGYKEDGSMLYGEDTYFCQHAIKKGGLDVWADPTLGVKHIGEALY
jgi:hypothetical protein